MNYIDKGFIKINVSPIILLIKLLVSNILLDLVAIIILAINYANMISNGHSVFNIEQAFFLGTLLLQLIMIFVIFIKWLYKYYLFENNKLTYYSGIIFKKKQEFILDKIGSTSFEQSILGKICNYSDIIIYIGNQKFALKGIDNPNEFIKLLGYFKIKQKN